MDVRVPQSRQELVLRFNRSSTFLLLTGTWILHFSVVNLFMQYLSRYLIDLQIELLEGSNVWWTNTLTLLLSVADVLLVKSENRLESGGLDRFLGYTSRLVALVQYINKPILAPSLVNSIFVCLNYGSAKIYWTWRPSWLGVTRWD